MSPRSPSFTVGPAAAFPDVDAPILEAANDVFGGIGGVWNVSWHMRCNPSTTPWVSTPSFASITGWIGGTKQHTPLFSLASAAPLPPQDAVDQSPGQLPYAKDTDADAASTSTASGHTYRRFCASCLELIADDDLFVKECRACHRHLHQKDPCTSGWRRFFGNMFGGKNVVWFHDDECAELYRSLQRISERGEIPLNFSDVPALRSYTFQLVKPFDDTDRHSRVAGHILSILADQFGLLPPGELLGYDWSALLRHVGQPTCAATFDVYGKEFAQLGLVGIKRRRGERNELHGEVMVSVLEQMLHGVGVKKVVVQCEDKEEMEMWNERFGFRTLDARDLMDMAETIPIWHSRDVESVKFMVRSLDLQPGNDAFEDGSSPRMGTQEKHAGGGPDGSGAP